MVKKSGVLILAAAAVSFSLSSCLNEASKPVPVAVDPPARQGTALIITGAAARIPQEAALLEELADRGLLKDLVFISGVSSGALNAVALNGVLSGRMTWDQYKKTLFGIKNSDIFLQRGKRLPVDTTPARKTYSKVVEGMLGYKKIGDLPFATSLSITRLKDLGLKKTAYRMCSQRINSESDPGLGLVDILMASSAFPAVFPSIRITGATTIPDIEYVDGGAGEDYIPYQALMEFEKFRGQPVNRVYIISRKNDGVPELSEELKSLGINDHKIFDDLGISFDAIANRKLFEDLEKLKERAPDLASRVYVYKPEFDENFLLFDFTEMEKQYTLTSQWAKTHDPVPLDGYLASHRAHR